VFVRSVEVEGRVFEENFEFSFWGGVVCGKVVCLICSKGLSVTKKITIYTIIASLNKEKFGILM
jgi:hypothetical protein